MWKIRCRELRGEYDHRAVRRTGAGGVGPGQEAAVRAGRGGIGDCVIAFVCLWPGLDKPLKITLEKEVI